LSAIDAAKEKIVGIQVGLERAFMAYCYDILGVDFPERGFLLFWQLPLDDKLKYFEIEEQVAGLTAVADAGERKNRLDHLLGFLGPIPCSRLTGLSTPVMAAGSWHTWAWNNLAAGTYSRINFFECSFNIVKRGGVGMKKKSRLKSCLKFCAASIILSLCFTGDAQLSFQFKN
jgi:hypothetical protein